MEFVKVASDGDVEVYQAMQTIVGTPKPTGEIVEMPVPVTPDVTLDVCEKALGAFKGREVRALSVSDSGVSVRVAARRCPSCDEPPADDVAKFCSACGSEL